MNTSFSLTAISYHLVGGAGDFPIDGLKSLSVDRFEKQLDHIEKNYQVISWPQLRGSLAGNSELSDRACLLTFDDGTIDHYSVVFPQLKKRGLSGLFFLIAGAREEGLPLVHLLQFFVAKVGEQESRELFLKTADEKTRALFFEKEKECLRDFPTSRFDDITFRTFKRVVGRYMYHEALPILQALFQKHVGDSKEYAQKLYLAPDMIREMKNGGMHFGGHGARHRWLATASSKEQEEEIASSRNLLETIGEGPYAFSYPYGDYSDSLRNILRENNFVSAFTVKEKADHDDFFAIGRFDANSVKLQ